MTNKRTCTTCKHRIKCLVYHSIVDAYSEILIAEIADGKKIEKWLREALKQAGKICRYYEEEGDNS